MSIVKEIKFNKQLIYDLLNSVPSGSFDASIAAESNQLFAKNADLYEQHIMAIEEDNKKLKIQVQLLKDALASNWP
jgi:hypothetical protein